MDHPPRVLVVDDEPSVLTSICMVLEFHGFCVTIAADLRGAFNFLQKDFFDVVLTDLRMAGAEDGLAVIAAVRALSPQSIVFLMSAHPSVTGSAASLKLRGDEILPKPTDIATMVRRINERLGIDAGAVSGWLPTGDAIVYDEPMNLDETRH